MYTHLFRNRNFVALWVGQIISFLGDYFVMLAMPIAINRLTGSAMMVGLSYISSSVPALALGPLAGVFIDRWDRRKVMITADLVRAGFVLFMLFVRSAEQVWIFYLAGFLISCTSQFFFPARNAVLPLVVANKSDLLAANGLMQIVQTIGFLLGPALAGFAIGLWGEAIAFIANSIGYLSSALAIFLITVPHIPVVKATGAHPVKEVLGELKEGLAFLFTNRSTLGVTVMLTVAQLGIGAFVVVWVPFLQRFYNQGAQGVGLVDAAFGAGMLIGGFLLGFLALRKRKTLLASLGMVGMGLLAAPIGYAPTFFLIVLLNFLFGIIWTPVQAALNTIMQLAVPDEKRGRISSSLNASITAGGLISMALASFFAEIIGLRELITIVGVILVLSGLSGFKFLQEPESIQDEGLAPEINP